MKKITLMFFMSLVSLCAYPQLALEGFEGTWPPTGWGIYDNGIGTNFTWVQTPAASPTLPAYQGDHAAYMRDENVLDGIPADWLTTPQFTVPVNPQLRFWSRLTQNNNQGTMYEVRISTDPDQSNLAAYQLVEDWTETEINPIQQQYTEKTVSLPDEFIGQQVYIAFVMLGDAGDRWLIDNVKVVEQCLDPENLDATDISLTSATLTWDNPSGADSWEIEIIEADEVPTGTGIIHDGLPSYPADGLEEDSDYKFYVRAICDNGETSAWVGAHFFSTPALGATCGAPIIIPDLPYSTTDNTGGYGDDYNGIPGENCGTEEWEEYLNGDDVVYSYTAPADGVISVEMTDSALFAGLFVYTDCDDIGVNCIGSIVINGDEAPTSIPDLAVTEGQTYYFVISSWGDFPQTTPYSLTIQAEACDRPEDLAASNIGNTTAELSWSNPSGADEWEIVVQDPTLGVPAGAGTPVSGNPVYTADDLTEATPYEFYVRADCGNGTFSSWAGPFFFNTTICEPEEQCVYTFILTGQFGWEENTMTVSQNGIPMALLGPEFTEGEGPFNVEVFLCDGLDFQIFWNFGGFSADLIGLEVHNSFGQVVYTKPPGEGLPNSLLHTGPVDCDNMGCFPPSGLTFDNPTMNTADLSWEGAATAEWEYYYVEAGGPAPDDDSTVIPSSTNQFTLSGLEPATNYEYYVRYVCSDTETSEWAGPEPFHTTVCPPAEQCLYTFEMTDSWGDGWNGNTMTIFQAGVPVATIGSEFEDGESAMAQVPLCPDLPFEVFWNEGFSFWEVGLVIYAPGMEDIFTMLPDENSPGNTIYSGTTTCTPPACLKPQNLNATDITLTTAVLDWTQEGDAAEWEVAILPVGSPAPTEPGVVVTETTLLAEDLSSGTAYEFYVRANCGEDGYSTWKGPYVFITLIENDECENAVEVPVNLSPYCDESVSGTITGATGSGVEQDCVTWQPIEYDVWFEFTAEAETHNVILSNVNNAFLEYVIFEGDECGNLTQLECGFDNTTLTGLTIGTTYKIMVFTTWMDDPSDITSFDLCVRTPVPGIRVSDDEYTVEELVQDVLIGSDCALITNISAVSGSDFGTNLNSIGYFNKENSDFPFDYGIVLSTGGITEAPGPFPGNIVEFDNEDWPGDTDLADIIAVQGLTDNIHNATVLEFDFVPLTEQMSFDFLFASNEYGTYQCDYSDAFAFILTGPAPGTDWENLAVIPNTEIPVSVVNIRDGQYNDACGSENIEYFGQYNQDENAMATPIGYGGQTVVMQAQASVVQGQQYHIKMVIADYRDTGVNSAVFLNGGSFSLGDIDLGLDLTVENGNAVCAGEVVTIESGLDPADYEFEWQQDGETIPGETEPNLSVTEEGEYTVIASYIGSSCSTDGSIIVEFYQPVKDVTGDPSDLTACNKSGFHQFDLSQNTATILAGLDPEDYDITYHLTAVDAEEGENELDLTYENTTQFLQTIYVRIYNSVTRCHGVKAFNIIVQDLTPEFTLGGDFSICEGTSGTITVTPVNFDLNDPQVHYTWTFNGDELPDTTSSITVTQPGEYAVTVDNTGCSSVRSVEMDIIQAPVADDPADATACESYILPALSPGNSYHTEPGGGGTALAAGDAVTQSQTIYVFAQTGTTPNCTAENSFDLTIIPRPMLAAIGDGCEDKNFVIEVVFHADEEFYTPDNVDFAWTDESGNELGSGATLTVTQEGTYTVRVSPQGSPVECYTEASILVDDTACTIQKGISPNGDGYNQSFDLSALDVRQLSIFNRYGTEVYSFSGAYTNQWEGQGSGGDELPTGTYFYMIERANGENRTGWVYINREE